MAEGGQALACVLIAVDGGRETQVDFGLWPGHQAQQAEDKIVLVDIGGKAIRLLPVTVVQAQGLDRDLGVDRGLKQTTVKLQYCLTQ